MRGCSVYMYLNKRDGERREGSDGRVCVCDCDTVGAGEERMV